MIDSNQHDLEHHTLFLWCSEKPAPVGHWTTVLWQNFSSNTNEISIPYLVEQQSDVLKKRLLAWIYDLGELKINHKRLIDHLEIREGFSYWWMTSLAGKRSHTKSPRFYDAIRLLILEDLIQAYPVRNIILATHDKEILNIVKKLCKKNKINFKYRVLDNPIKKSLFSKTIYKGLFHPIQAIIYFAYYFLKHWKLRESITYFATILKSEITFFDFLCLVDKVDGQLHSNYWTTLVNYLSKAKIVVNWVHRYIPHEAVPSVASANDLLFRLNHEPDGVNHHLILESNLSFSLFYSSLRDYIWLLLQSFKLRHIKQCFHPQGSQLDLWLLFKPEWLKSIRGIDAVENCIILNSIEKLAGIMPTQKLGFYPQENQPWEMALIYAWRKCGHGKIVGVQHTTVRFWDLRYFFDPRTYLNRNKNALPIPDWMAINSPKVIQNYLKVGYPEHLYAKAEALRFLYLKKCTPSLLKKSKAITKHVLICGDNLAVVSQKILLWLNIASKYLREDIHYTYKPHPVCTHDIELLTTTLSLQTTDLPLIELFPNCDVVITSHISSAALDGYLYGLPVIQILDGDVFNMSPLRGVQEVCFVTNPKELANILQTLLHKELSSSKEFFYLDVDLPLWQKLIADNLR
jgi:surface carbohydrate biosynthesis protein (TIGR04326 family)